VLEILREEKTIAQMASEYGVHRTQLHRWKKQALESLPELFERDDRQERAKGADQGPVCPDWPVDRTGELAQKKSSLDHFEK